MSNWISVEYEVPPIGLFVKLKCKKGEFKGFLQDSYCWSINGRCWPTYKSNRSHYISHWKPLPEYTKKEKQNA